MTVAGLTRSRVASARTVGSCSPTPTCPAAIAVSMLPAMALAERPRIAYCAATSAIMYQNKGGSSMDTLTPTARTALKRLPKRGSYDRAEMHRILDEALICHVGFVSDATPVVIPT